MAYNWKNAALFGPLGGFFGGKKKKSGFDVINPPPYTGASPYSGADVGYGPEQLSGLASAYLPELKRRAMGEGLVGFDPRRREILRNEYLQDFGDYANDIYKKASAQASGQGLRGGIPVSISEQYTKNLSRARESGLANIDIEDLAARREDINRAFYQQPEEISRGAGIQQNRANFDLAKYNATLPTYLENSRQNSGILPALIGAAGTIGGAYVGQPQLGALAGSYLSNQIPAVQSTSRYGGYDTSLYNDPYYRKRIGISSTY